MKESTVLKRIKNLVTSINSLFRIPTHNDLSLYLIGKTPLEVEDYFGLPWSTKGNMWMYRKWAKYEKATGMTTLLFLYFKENKVSEISFR